MGEDGTGGDSSNVGLHLEGRRKHRPQHGSRFSSCLAPSPTSSYHRTECCESPLGFSLVPAPPSALITLFFPLFADDTTADFTTRCLTQTPMPFLFHFPFPLHIGSTTASQPNPIPTSSHRHPNAISSHPQPNPIPPSSQPHPIPTSSPTQPHPISNPTPIPSLSQPHPIPSHPHLIPNPIPSPSQPHPSPMDTTKDARHVLPHPGMCPSKCNLEDWQQPN